VSKIISSEQGMEYKEYYKIMGVKRDATQEEIKRAAYDQLGANWKAGQDFSPPPDWNAGFEFSGGGFTGADSSAYSDFFASLFGQNFSSLDRVPRRLSWTCGRHFSY
jgi:curved DNA-binding protein